MGKFDKGKTKNYLVKKTVLLAKLELFLSLARTLRGCSQVLGVLSELVKQLAVIKDIALV